MISRKVRRLCLTGGATAAGLAARAAQPGEIFVHPHHGLKVWSVHSMDVDFAIYQEL